MKRHNRSNSSTGREGLIRRTRITGRELGAHSTIFHAVIAERLKLSLSDLRAWDLLLLHGPMTHGKFAEMVGLSGASVTSLVDRLQRAGAVRRETDTDDRRRVLIKVVSSSREGSQKEIFDSLGSQIEAVLGEFSDEELAASCRLMQQVGLVMKQFAVQLRLNAESAPAHSPVPMTKRRRTLAIV